MSRLFTIVLILCLSGCQGSCSLKINQSDNKYEDITDVKIVSIYDGDTFTIDIGDYPAIIGHRIKVRVNGIDCPELKSKDEAQKELARKAKQRTVQLLREAQQIDLVNPRRDKYFRILADVKLSSGRDTIDLAETLLKEGLAKKYDGGKK